MRETGKTKHYGIHNTTHKRLILLCLENPEKKGTTIAVEYDNLDAETRSELIQIIDGPEAQSVKDAYIVLKKKVFQEHPQTTALKYLLNSGFAKEYNVNDITLFIEPNRTVPLAKMIEEVNAYEMSRMSQAKDNPFVEAPVSLSGSINQEVEAPVENPAPQPVKAEAPKAVESDAVLSVLSSLTSVLSEMNAKLDKLSAKEEEAPKAKPAKTEKKSTKKK